MLADRIKSEEDTVKKFQEEFAAEFKLDGERAQIHKQKDRIMIFSRSLENITSYYPDIVEKISERIVAENVILEAEVVAMNSNSGDFLPFQELMHRRRKYEIDGVHYNFINKEQFEKMIEENLFLEHENVHGDLYGTALSSLEQYIDNNKHLFFELDVNGAVSLMNYYPSNTISIFLSPPNIEELRKRLVLRSTETEDEINKRLSRFEEEDNLKKEFDYNLINDNFETTFEKIKEIINRYKKED